MRYTLLLHYPEETAESLGPEAMEEGQRAFTSYAATLEAAGVLLSAEIASFDWPAVTTVLAAMVLLTLAVDLVSARARTAVR